MPNKLEDHNEPQALPTDIRAAFQAYPRPKASSDFDERFWRELDARQYRYRGLIGFCRRVLEVEIEGVAIWRLGLSTLGGSGTFALGFVLLEAFSTPHPSIPTTPVLPFPSAPTTSPRYAREVWDETLRPARQAQRKIQSKPLQGGVSCQTFASDWA